MKSARAHARWFSRRAWSHQNTGSARGTYHTRGGGGVSAATASARGREKVPTKWRRHDAVRPHSRPGYRGPSRASSLAELLDGQRHRPEEAAEEHREQADPAPSVPYVADLKGLLLRLVRRKKPARSPGEQKYTYIYQYTYQY